MALDPQKPPFAPERATLELNVRPCGRGHSDDRQPLEA